MTSTPLVRPRWLLTPCAHRLRKPHRTNQTSDALCRRTGARRSAPRSSQPAPQRDVNRAWAPRSARPRSRPRRVRATTIPEPGRLLLVETPDLATGAGSVRAHCYVCPRSPRTLSPTANRAPAVSEEPPRQADPAPALRALRPASPRWGRCVLPTSATDLRDEHPMDRSILESPSPPAFAGGVGFHAPRPAETLTEGMIEWSLA